MHHGWRRTVSPTSLSDRGMLLLLDYDGGMHLLLAELLLRHPHVHELGSVPARVGLRDELLWRHGVRTALWRCESPHRPVRHRSFDHTQDRRRNIVDLKTSGDQTKRS